MANITALFNHPIGIGSVALMVLAIGLFIWNLRREELTHEQWIEIRDNRRPYLSQIRDCIDKYMATTGELSKNDNLYKLEAYGFKGHTAIELLSIIQDNRQYSRLKTENNTLDTLRTKTEMLISKTGSKRLRQLVRSGYRREHIARSYSIYLTLYRTKYNPHPEIEKRIHQSKSIGALEQSLSRIYEYLDVMWRGKDLE